MPTIYLTFESGVFYTGFFTYPLYFCSSTAHSVNAVGDCVSCCSTAVVQLSGTVLHQQFVYFNIIGVNEVLLYTNISSHSLTSDYRHSAF